MTDHHPSSIDETHANDTSSQNRRGFLKRVAGAGLAGVAGIGAVTQEARAATAQINFGCYSGQMYYSMASSDNVWFGNNTESHDDDTGWQCQGYVSQGYKDTVYYRGWLRAVTIVGNGWAWLPNNVSDEVNVVGTGPGRSYYELVPHGTIGEKYNGTNEVSDHVTSNIAKGYVYHNHVDENALTDGVKIFRVNGDAYFYVERS